MKKETKLSLIYFFIIIFYFSIIASFKIDHDQIKDIKQLQDLKNRLTDELRNLEEEYSHYKEIYYEKIQNNQTSLNLNMDLIYKSIKSATSNLQILENYIIKLKEELDSSYNKSQEDKYKKVIEERNSNGMTDINELLKNFKNKKSTLEKVERIYNTLDENRIKKLSKKSNFVSEKSPDIKKLSDSSWIFQKNSVEFSHQTTADDVVKIIIISFLSSLPPAYCWKNMPLEEASFQVTCKDSWDRYASICYQKCPIGYTNKGGVCFKDCEGKTDCTFFCSNSENCRSLTDLESKTYFPVEIDIYPICKESYQRSGSICTRDCNYLGLENCDLHICSSSPNMCHFNLSKPPNNFLKAYVNFFGYIFNLKSKKHFGYSEPESMKQILNEIQKYTENNKNRLNEVFKIISIINKNQRSKSIFFDNVIKRGLEILKPINEKETQNFSRIISGVSSQWLELLKESKSYSFKNILENEMELTQNWKECSLKRGGNYSICILKIINFVRYLAPHDLVQVVLEFEKPVCRF
jgi:hypothetical protein